MKLFQTQYHPFDLPPIHLYVSTYIQFIVQDVFKILKNFRNRAYLHKNTRLEECNQPLRYLVFMLSCGFELRKT